MGVGVVLMINSLIACNIASMLFDITKMKVDEFEKSKPKNISFINSMDSENGIHMHVLDYFKCLISLDLMYDSDYV